LGLVTGNRVGQRTLVQFAVIVSHQPVLVQIATSGEDRQRSNVMFYAASTAFQIAGAA
jgi:phosphohistidine phosphatase SixA